MPTSDALNGERPAPLELSRDVARRYLALHHLLAPPRSLPAEPASVMAVFDRLGLDPVRPDRRRRPEPRPRAARPDRGLPPRVDRRAAVRGAPPVRDLQQDASRSCPTAELPWYRHQLGPERTRHDGGDVRRARGARRGAPRTDPGPRGRCRRRDVGRARGDRLVLAAHEPGPGDPRGARRGRHARHRPARRQPARLRPGRAAVPGGAPRASGIRRASSVRHKLLSRYRGHGLLGASGEYELCAGTYSRASSASRTGCRWGGDAKLALDELVEAGTLLPVEVDGVKGAPVHRRRGGGIAATGAARRSAAGDSARRRRPRRRVPRAARPARLGPRVPAPLLRLRLHLGGLRPGPEAALGLLRPADPLRRPARRPDRAADRPQGRRARRPGRVVGGRVRPARGRGVRRRARRSPRRPSSLRGIEAGRLAADRSAAALVDAVKRHGRNETSVEGARSGLRPDDRAVSARSKPPRAVAAVSSGLSTRCPSCRPCPGPPSGSRRCGRRQARASSTASSCSHRPSSTPRHRSAAGPASS